MPKRTSNSSINSSIRQNTTATNEGFGQLLDLQKLSNEHLQSIRDVLSHSLNTQRVQAFEELQLEKNAIKGEKELEKMEDTLRESLKIGRAHV